jgi:hypothetical protein
LGIIWTKLFIPFRFGCTGFRWDRQWLVVNYKGRAYTQRVEPKLALVEVQLPNEAFLERWVPSKSSYLGENIYLLSLILDTILLSNTPTMLSAAEKFITKLEMLSFTRTY